MKSISPIQTVLAVFLFLGAGIAISCKTSNPPGLPPGPDPGSNPGSNPGPVADAGITLSEGPCFGTCPVYSVTVYPNEFFELTLDRFTRAPGTTETGTFAEGTWATALAALQSANFNSLPTNVTIGSPDCGDTVMTDLPQATISERTIAGTRTIDYYPGCRDAPARPALDQLLEDLRVGLGIPGLVTP